MNPFDSLLPEILTYLDKAERATADRLPRNMSLCGRQIRIAYSSKRLETSLFRAFQHLETLEPTSEPPFRIFVCDGNVLSSALPGYPLMEEFSAIDKKILMFNEGNIHALYNPDSRIFSLVDIGAGRGWHYLPNAADLPYYEKAAPMRMLLHWCCEMAGRVLVHAAAVGWESRAALLAGRGGTGKSTTAMLAVQNGFSFLGDDYVVLDNAREPSVISAYNSVKFRWETLERLPSAGIFSVNNPDTDEKGYFYLHETHPDVLVETLPLKVVLLPAIEHQNKTTFVRLPSTRGLLNLAASSIFQMPGSGRPTLQNLANILRDTPVYQMSLGTDNAEITQALKYFLSSLKR